MECATSFKVTSVRELVDDLADEHPTIIVDKISTAKSNVVNFNFFIIYLLIFLLSYA
jgi:hypothetical protein